MTNFNDLTSEQLTYLKQKWSAESFAKGSGRR